MVFVSKWKPLKENIKKISIFAKKRKKIWNKIMIFGLGGHFKALS